MKQGCPFSSVVQEIAAGRGREAGELDIGIWPNSVSFFIFLTKFSRYNREGAIEEGHHSAKTLGWAIWQFPLEMGPGLGRI